MNIAICDDNLQFIENIETYLDGLKNIKIQHDVFTDGESLLSIYERREAGYDAVFLDIELSNMNGIEVANRIRMLDRHVLIIFVTAFEKYMEKSFECLPFRFLLKPLEKDVFLRVCEAIDKRLTESPTAFTFVENNISVRVCCEDIVFIESKGHYILLHMKEGRIYRTRGSIAKIIKILDKANFVRIHRGFAVNLRYIHKINDTKIYLHGVWSTIPMSRTYRQKLADAFIDFKERKYLL